MILIPDHKKAITHYGVRGQRWGVRKEQVLANIRARREKAAKVTNELNKEGVGVIKNRSDFDNANWASKSIGEKAARAITGAVARSVVTSFIVNQELPNFKDPAWGIDIAKKAAMTYGTREITSQTAMNRYTEAGKRDPSKRQHKGLTPEHAIQVGVFMGVTAAPVIGAVAKQRLSSVLQNRAATRARMERWGPNILDKKTSDMETVFDDGYMSVLQKIKV